GISQILVAVHASGLNPTDWKHRAHRAFLPDPPFVLGWDVSGVVEAVGFGGTLFKPGDGGFRMLPSPFGVGAPGEYVVGPARGVGGPGGALGPKAWSVGPGGGGRPAAGGAARGAGPRRPRRYRGRPARAHPRRGRRRWSPGRTDRQSQRRVRHRHRQPGQPRV